MVVEHNIFQYRGSSMTGTFRPGDMLVVRETAFADVRPGDVVAFRAPGGDDDATLIVHRVMARAADGLITRGDACGAPDAARVQAGDLVGRVVQAQRGRHVRRVWGGFAGRCWARLLRLRRRVLALGRLPYRRLRASGLVRRVWRPAVTQVSVMTTQGPVVKYLCGARAVAEWRPETRVYRCRKPYDLVLDAPAKE
ncbi:MAG: signal peptidase I [Anaerolineae bacterium]|nr:signal peptidase I [Anaerolineae bacterium]